MVAFFHHCAYSTTNNHASDGGLRGALDPLFTKYQVDLVVQGHNHLFERTDPIKNGKKTRSAPDGSVDQPGGRRRHLHLRRLAAAGRATRSGPHPSASAPPPDGVTPIGPQAAAGGPALPRLRAGGRREHRREQHRERGEQLLLVGGRHGGERLRLSAGHQGPGGRSSWSQVRYDAYAFIAVDVVPAAHGLPTTFTIRTLADALPGRNEPYSEIDTITLRRISGRSRIKNLS